MVTAWACGTSIWAMSHCWPHSGSAVGSPVAAGASASVVAPSSMAVPSPSVEATDSTPEPATAPAKAVLLDRAMSTPILS